MNSRISSFFASLYIFVFEVAGVWIMENPVTACNRLTNSTGVNYPQAFVIVIAIISLILGIVAIIASMYAFNKTFKDDFI